MKNKIDFNNRKITNHPPSPASLNLHNCVITKQGPLFDQA